MNKNVVIAVLIALLIGNAMGFAIGKSVGRAAPNASVASSVEAQSSISLEESQPVKPAAESELGTAPVEVLPSSSSLGAEPSSSSAEVQPANTLPAPASTPAASSVSEDGSYTSKDDVAAYIHEFGHLPPNYISKSKAKKAGWVAKEGNLDKVLPGMSIGGSEFYNDEGQLPDAPGRTWTECDINYEGGFRGAERIVFSNDGLIFYTADHYKTFEQLY